MQGSDEQPDEEPRDQPDEEPRERPDEEPREQPDERPAEDPFEEALREISKALSPERLGSYGRGWRTDRDALALYLWNAALCEALYPVLHGLEVALRNAVMQAGAEAYAGCAVAQVPCWLDAKPPILLPGERARVEQAKRRLTDRGSALEPGNVVAELSFGFWTALFDVRYEQNKVLWPRLFKHGLFAGAPRRLRSRHALSPLLNRVRNLRNRAAHHEPIWHWRDLAEQHAVARDLLGWLCPYLRVLVERFDRFEHEYRAGLAAKRLLLDAFITDLAERAAGSGRIIIVRDRRPPEPPDDPTIPA